MTALEAAAATDAGCVRTHNEDAFLVGQHLWAVADGMGGQAAGDAASRIAMDCVRQADRSGPIDQSGIADLIARINQRILDFGVRHPDAVGLGTTLAGVGLITLAGRAHWLVFHVGDSRVYRLTGGVLHQETADHSEVQGLVDDGQITAEAARTHPRRNVLIRALGSPEPPRADIRVIPYLAGDIIVVCSDGLPSEVADATMETILLTAPGPREAVDALVAAARANGGRDNITAIVIGVGGVEDAEYAVEDTLPIQVVGEGQ